MNEEETSPLSEDAAANLLEAAFFGLSSEEDMDQAAVDLSTDLPLIEGYKLIRLLGEGGFGMVYEAEQRMPIRRRVALKVLRPGCTTRELLARFEQERQALALMNHPHIARIYDAGETEDGRPFIAMEMVEGQTIDKRAKTLPQRDRVALMLEVSRAVAHAHHKGIIHRDLKPSNLLITDSNGKPEPRVIDFGIAKALDGPLVTKVMFTKIRQVVGTPGYMSPERQHTSQISHSADTRTDVFALGAILWELLSGSTPLQSPEGTGTRVTLPHALGIPKELRWITEKATDPDMDRRYANADGLADDLEAWLEGQPLKAAPRSSLYVVIKWASRHRAAALAGVLLLITLIASLLLLTHKNLEIRQALLQAEHNHAETLRRSSNESYLMGVTRERRRPTLALAHWAHALRQDPRNQAALGMALATLKYRGHPAIAAPAMSFCGGKVDQLVVAAGGDWFAALVEDGSGQVVVCGRRGDTKTESYPVPADAAMKLLAISNAGQVAVAASQGPVGLLQKDGTWKASARDFDSLRFLAWTPDQELWLVTANEVSRCDASGVDTGPRYPLGGHEVCSAASPDGSSLAVAIASGRIHGFAAGAAEPNQLQGPLPAPCSALALDVTGKRIAAAWRSGDVWVNHGDGSSSSFLADDAVLQLDFSRHPSGLFLRLPRAVGFWDSNPGAPTQSFPTGEPLRTLVPISEAAVMIQANFRRPALLDFASDTPFVEEISGMEGRSTCAVDRTQGSIVVAHEDHSVIEWLRYQPATTPTQQILPQGPWLTLHSGRDKTLALGVNRRGEVCRLSADGKSELLWETGEFLLHQAALDRDANLVLANTPASAGVKLIHKEAGSKTLLWGKPSALALSSDGLTAALGYPAGEVRVFDVPSEREISVKNWRRGAVSSLCFISNDRLAAAVAGQVQVWDWRQNQVLPTPIELSPSIRTMSASSTGTRLAVLGTDDALHVIDVETGRRVLGQTKALNAATVLLWSDDDSQLWQVNAKGDAVVLPMPPFFEACPAWFPAWLEHHIGLKMDDRGNAVRLRSKSPDLLPANMDEGLRRWLTMF